MCFAVFSKNFLISIFIFFSCFKLAGKIIEVKSRSSKETSSRALRAASIPFRCDFFIVSDEILSEDFQCLPELKI